MKLTEGSATYIMKRVQQETSPQEKLHAFIFASLEYQTTHPAHNTALIEIVFHARTPDNTPYYKLSDEDEEPMLKELKLILQQGNNDGTFSDYFNVDVMANMIQGAIGEYMFNPSLTKKLDVKTYSKELINIIAKNINEK